MAADTQTELLARAGGNPLYAEEYARMLADRVNVGDVLPETEQTFSSWRGLVPMPDERVNSVRRSGASGRPTRGTTQCG